MSTDAAARPEIFVTIAGQRVEIILPGHGWTFDEALLAKQVSEGMAPVEIEQRAMLGDAHAWLALLRVSYERAGLRFDRDKLGGLDLLQLAADVYTALQEALDGPLGDEPPSLSESPQSSDD